MVVPRSLVLPFLWALCGVTSDFVTTFIGLRMGFCEIHPQYDPFVACLFYEGAVALLSLTLPKKFRNLGANGLALTSYLAAANNILVILEFLRWANA